MNCNAESVRAVRQRLGLSQERFAAEIGVSFSTVSRWENAHRKPSPLSWRAVRELLRRHGLGEDFLQCLRSAHAE
jgi:putative transcriptional regulator